MLLIGIFSISSTILTASAGSGDEIIIAADQPTSKQSALEHELSAFPRMSEAFGSDFVGLAGFSSKAVLHCAILFNNDYTVEAICKDLIKRENFLVFDSVDNLATMQATANTHVFKGYLSVVNNGGNIFVYYLNNVQLTKVGPLFNEFLTGADLRASLKQGPESGYTVSKLPIGDVNVVNSDFSGLVEFKSYSPISNKAVELTSLEQKYGKALSPYLHNQILAFKPDGVSGGYYKAPFAKEFVPFSTDSFKNNNDISQGFLDLQLKRKNLLQHSQIHPAHKVHLVSGSLYAGSFC